MFETSRIEISRSALRSNLRFLRRQLGDHPRISSVVKGNAYGHGIEIFVPLSEELGVSHFSVYSAEEALQVSRSLTRPGTTICIMGDIDDAELDWAAEHAIEVWIGDRQRLDAAIAAGRRVGQPLKVHLEFETGLYRTGLEIDDIQEVVQAVLAAPSAIQVVGHCTHLAGAESIANYRRIQDQIECFDGITRRLSSLGLSRTLAHTACSAAALSYPETVKDMARIGIAQYGFWPSRETYMDHVARQGRRGQSPLRRLLTWKSRVMSTKLVPAGRFIGYGTSFLAERDLRVATVPVGYACGFARSLSNRGRVLVRGRRAAVIGVVNMSCMLINVTSIPEAQRGDEVVLIGNQGRLSITVGSFVEFANLLNYEMLCRLPASIPRTVVP